MLYYAEILEHVLAPLLVVGGVLLGLLLASLVIQRVVRELAWRRRETLVARYRPLVDAITHFGPTPQTLTQLRQAPRVHRRILASMLLAPLRSATGDLVAHVRDAAAAIGLVEQWFANLGDRRWWVRAESVRALAFIQDTSARPAIVRALDDEHEEVRAAAVEAAGRLGDPLVIPALLTRLADGSRYQRARVIDALRCLGPPVTPALIALAHARPDRARLAMDVLGLIGTVAAIEPLLQWCGDARSDVRAAAVDALGSIGLDDRSYYFALRALGDADPHARAMAARALGRARREEASSYLAEALDDEWLPAAQAAGALRRLGEKGLAALRAHAADEGQAGDLARQMLWSQQPIPAHA